jgi:glycosyltransferase involved in cell wall biosynthesis
MKVLILSPLPPPVGGIASWTVNVLDFYRKSNDNEIIIFHQNTAIRKRKITQNSFHGRLISGLKEIYPILKKLKINLLTNKPDIIHLTSSSSLALIKDLQVLRSAKRRNIPVVVHFRFGRIPELASKKNWEWVLLLRVIKKSTHTIVIDKTSLETLINAGLTNISYIPNPVSFELEGIAKGSHFNQIQKRLNRVVFVGHLIPLKGIFELVQTCSLIPQVEELVLIGPYEMEIKNQIIKLAQERENIDWIIFKGVLNKYEVYDELHKSALMILPSYTEGFPNIILEAMACSCPVIATNVGAIPEMLNTETKEPCGVCVNPKNIIELKNAIEDLIQDINKQKDYSEKAREKVLNCYTLSVILKEYETLWSKIIS